MPTSNYNIWTPSGPSQLTPIQTPFVTLAESVDDALLEVESAIPTRVVANQTERNALYPSPQQGDSVYRLDRGWVERYYTAYNATSNPGGRGAAGWYAPSGHLISSITVSWPDTADVSDSTASPFFIKRQSIADPGVPYRVQAWVGAEAGSSAAGTRWDIVLGVTDVGGTTVLENLAHYTGGESIAYKQVMSLPSSTVFTGTKDVAAYLNRAYGSAPGRVGATNHRMKVTVWAA